MEYLRLSVFLIIIFSDLLIINVNSFDLCKVGSSIECLSTEENDCNFVDEHTTFNYSLVDEKTSNYNIEFVSLKNACGFHNYNIYIELLRHAKTPKDCRYMFDPPDEDNVNLKTMRFFLDDYEQNCSQLKIEFCMKYWFSGCYLFSVSPFIGTNSHKSVSYYVWLENNHTLEDFFINAPLFQIITLKGHPVEVAWEFKPGSFVEGETDFGVMLKRNNENSTDVTNSCSLLDQTVTCQFFNLTEGKYTLYFQFKDSWRCYTEDLFGACIWPIKITKSNTVSSEYKFEITVGSQLKYLDWILVGALIVVFALILVAVFWFRKYKHRANINVPIEIYHTDSKKCVRGIFLLYARDCTPFMDTMAELRKYFAIRTKFKVYDIFDPKLFDEVATSPHEFVESLLQDPQINVIVISTECFEQLYQSMLQYYSHQSNQGKEISHLSQLYRVPHWLDGLVIHALKLISYDTSPTSYKKFYVVRLPKFNGLGNYLIHINPCTRFDIPGGLDTLIEKVSSFSLENGMMESIDIRESLHRTLYNLNTFVLNKPEYLYKDVLKNKLDWKIDC